MYAKLHTVIPRYRFDVGKVCNRYYGFIPNIGDFSFLSLSVSIFPRFFNFTDFFFFLTQQDLMMGTRAVSFIKLLVIFHWALLYSLCHVVLKTFLEGVITIICFLYSKWEDKGSEKVSNLLNINTSLEGLYLSDAGCVLKPLYIA